QHLESREGSRRRKIALLLREVRNTVNERGGLGLHQGDNVVFTLPGLRLHVGANGIATGINTNNDWHFSPPLMIRALFCLRAARGSISVFGNPGKSSAAIAQRRRNLTAGFKLAGTARCSACARERLFRPPCSGFVGRPTKKPRAFNGLNL